ncbi:DUF1294 domain-containing protein [Paenibacillus sp. FSL H8-0537]|uniref:DUF1294 domain-containing protein n=1 Tax=Paenibacillus sp. FSL H8-0537 TaxID=2921399 RepID=UPI0031016E43
MSMELFILFILAINCWTFTLMYLDKQSARRQQRRIPEKRLFTLSALGGAIGAYAGMRAWRHKTKHRSFIVGIPLLVLLNLLLFAAALHYVFNISIFM